MEQKSADQQQVYYYYLYKITNLINNKIYIGVHYTTDLNDGYMGSGKLLRLAEAKYGIENFRKDILEFFDSKDTMLAREREIVNPEFIKRSDTYNICLGGTGGGLPGKLNPMYGKTHTPEARAKISNGNRGKIVSEESRKKNSESHKGKPFTEEHKLHLSEAERGSKNHMFGKHQSVESNKKRSESLKGHKMSDLCRQKFTFKGHHFSKEQKKRLSNSCKGHQSSFKGQHFSKESKRKLSNSLKTSQKFHDKLNSKEYRNKISKANKNKKWYNNGQKCIRLKPEEKIPNGFVPGRLLRNKK